MVRTAAEGEPEMAEKRKDYLSWDDYFMGLAILSAQRSKDPNSQVGACIVDDHNKIVGIGYNGFPSGCSDDELPWAREADSTLDTKYPYVCHAELNAILNTNIADTSGCRLYVTLFPCNECAKLIIQSGIREIIFLSDKYRDSDSNRAARRMFDMVGVRYRIFRAQTPRIVIDFSEQAAKATQV
jgi:dCMP deaminase